MDNPFNPQRRWALCALAGVLARPSVAVSAAPASGEAKHEHVLSSGLKVSMVDYAVPEIWLVRDDDKKVLLAKELDDGRPLVLNFIYTTCPGICPMMSQVFSQFQSRLGADREKVHMVSISIDPEQDTPARLREYARRFSAGSQWRHYTGTVQASIAAQRAFNAYRGDKMNHDPLTLMRATPGKPWVRIDGFATPGDLLEQYVSVAAMCEADKAAAR
jgi:protein SCO1/2